MRARAEMAAKARHAAEDIEDGIETLSCLALHWHTCNDRLGARYADFFRPQDIDGYGQWLIAARMRGYIRHEDMRNWRITALCFLAAMIESGDLDDVIEATYSA